MLRTPLIAANTICAFMENHYTIRVPVRNLILCVTTRGIKNCNCNLFLDNTYFEPEGEKCLYDRTQRKACSLAATTNYNKLLGYNNNPPPKTSYALTQAKRYREQAQKNDKNKKRG